MKSTTSITLDTEVLAEARMRGIKLSIEVNRFLKTFLSMGSKDKENLDIAKSKAVAELARIQSIEDAKKKKEAKRITVTYKDGERV